MKVPRCESGALAPLPGRHREVKRHRSEAVPNELAVQTGPGTSHRSRRCGEELSGRPLRTAMATNQNGFGVL